MKEILKMVKGKERRNQVFIGLQKIEKVLSSLNSKDK